MSDRDPRVDEEAWRLVAAGHRRRVEGRPRRPGQALPAANLGEISRAGRMLADVWAAGREYGVEPEDWTTCLPRLHDLVFDVLAASTKRRRT